MPVCLQPKHILFEKISLQLFQWWMTVDNCKMTSISTNVGNLIKVNKYQLNIDVKPI